MRPGLFQIGPRGGEILFLLSLVLDARRHPQPLQRPIQRDVAPRLNGPGQFGVVRMLFEKLVQVGLSFGQSLFGLGGIEGFAHRDPIAARQFEIQRFGQFAVAVILRRAEEFKYRLFGDRAHRAAQHGGPKAQ